MTKGDLVPRATAIGAFSIIAAARVSHDMLKKHNLGREGYLRYQSNWFDKYLANFSHPFGDAIGYAIFFAVGLFVYELVVMAFDRLDSLVRPKSHAE